MIAVCPFSVIFLIEKSRERAWVPLKLYYINLILTSNPHSFEISCILETGLSTFHRMTVTVKNYYQNCVMLILKVAVMHFLISCL